MKKKSGFPWLILAGVMMIWGGRIYHFFAHPEWTEALALRKLWWIWLAGALSVIVGILRFFDRVDTR